MVRVARIALHLFAITFVIEALRVVLHRLLRLAFADDLGACLSICLCAFLVEHMLRPYLPTRLPQDVLHPRAMLYPEDADDEIQPEEIMPRRRRAPAVECRK